MTAKASNLNKSQQPSTNELQQIQYQSLRNNKFQQVSISAGTWFGIRWPTSEKPFRFNIENAKGIEPC